MCLLEIREQKDCVVALEGNCTYTNGTAKLQECFLWIKWDQMGGIHPLWPGWILPRRTSSRNEVRSDQVKVWARECPGTQEGILSANQESEPSPAMGTVDRVFQHGYLARTPGKHHMRRGSKIPTLGMLYSLQAPSLNYVCLSLEMFHESHLSSHSLSTLKEPETIKQGGEEQGGDVLGSTSPVAGLPTRRRTLLLGRESIFTLKEALSVHYYTS